MSVGAEMVRLTRCERNGCASNAPHQSARATYTHSHIVRFAPLLKQEDCVRPDGWPTAAVIATALLHARDDCQH